MDVRNLLVAGVRGEVVAVDRRTGRERWRAVIDPEGGALTVALDQDRLVLVASATHLVCLGYDAGTLLWRAPLAIAPRASNRTTLLIDEGIVMIGRRGTVECFDRDGTRLWLRRIETTGDLDVLGFPGNLIQQNNAEAP